MVSRFGWPLEIVTSTYNRLCAAILRLPRRWIPNRVLLSTAGWWRYTDMRTLIQIIQSLLCFRSFATGAVPPSLAPERFRRDSGPHHLRWLGPSAFSGPEQLKRERLRKLLQFSGRPAWVTCGLATIALAAEGPAPLERLANAQDCLANSTLAWPALLDRAAPRSHRVHIVRHCAGSTLLGRTDSEV